MAINPNQMQMLMKAAQAMKGMGSLQAAGPGNPNKWLDSMYLTIASGDTWTLPSTSWRDCSGHAYAFVLLTIESLSTAGVAPWDVAITMPPRST